MLLEKENIFIDLKADNTNDVFEIMGSHMIQNGYAKDSFIQAIKTREKEYPTGLSIGKYGVAIPHTYPQHILKSSMTFARLEKPVSFFMMGTDDVEVDARLIFMLLLQEKAQLEMLQKIMKIIQDQGKLKKLYNAATEQEILQELAAVLC